MGSNEIAMKGRSLWSIGLGLGYSNFSGWMSYLDVRHEHFFFDRLSIGGKVYYDNVSNHEQYGTGPTATYYIWQNESVRTSLSQEVVFTHYSGASRGVSTIDGDSNDIIGRTYLGIGYSFLNFVGGYSYALDKSNVHEDRGFVGIQIVFYR